MSDRRMKVEDIMASTIVPSDQASGLSRARDTGRAARHARGSAQTLPSLCRSGKWIDSEIRS